MFEPAWCVNDLSLEERIGQMVVAHGFARFSGPNSADFRALAELVSRYHVGAFKLYHGSCLESAFLVHHLERLARFPLLIASDLERGVGQQLAGAACIPPAIAVAAAGNPEYADRAGEMTARQARAVGINMIFAPVADTCSADHRFFGSRSFGEDPGRISLYVSAFIEGVQRERACAVVKYFPGHGRMTFEPTGAASDSRLPVVSSTRQELEAHELIPFRAAIASGVRAVMTSHASYPALDPEDLSPRSGALPATWSRSVTNLLRDEMGFSGLIVTDALNLPAVRSLCSTPEAACRALSAGADLMVVLGSPADVVATLDAIRRKVFAGEIPEDRIDQSVGRMLRLKSWLGAYQLADPGSLSERLWGAFQGTLPQEIADRSLTDLRDGHSLTPAPQEPRRVLALVLGETGNADAGSAKGRGPGPELATRALAADVVHVSLHPSDAEIERLAVMALGYDLVVCAWVAIPPDASTCERVLQGVARTGVPRVLVGFVPLYELRDLRNEHPTICAHHYGEASQRSVIDLILGAAGRTGSDSPPSADAQGQEHRPNTCV